MMWFLNNLVKSKAQTDVLPSKLEKGQVDSSMICSKLKQSAPAIKLFFSACVHCTYCAETCFMYRNHEDDPTYMPSYKVIHTVGKLHRKKGKVTPAELEEIRELAWDKCALCTRCVCPFQLNIPGMIALARDICRSQGVVPEFDRHIPPVDELTRLPEVLK